MSLQINKIELINFRNYSSLILEDIGSISVFVGPNAIGKTNIIEALEYMTALSSFKHPKLSHVIKEGETDSYIHIKESDNERELQLDAHFSKHSRNYQLNGKKKTTAELKGLCPSVLFTPDDLELIKGSQSYRRNEFDHLGAQLSKNYFLIKKDYEEVIKHKNKLLKEEASQQLIDSINDLVITCGAQLTYFRIHLFSKLLPFIQEKYLELSNGKELLGGCYYPCWQKPSETPPYINGENSIRDIPSKEEIINYLKERLKDKSHEEWLRKKSIVGPHSDSIEFFINNKNSSLFASQGQQRSLVLAWKLAEVELIKENLGLTPILLLDDVMSELDDTRRESLISNISEDMQVFITTTTLDYFKGEFLKKISPIQLPLSQVGEK